MDFCFKASSSASLMIFISTSVSAFLMFSASLAISWLCLISFSSPSRYLIFSLASYSFSSSSRILKKSHVSSFLLFSSATFLTSSSVRSEFLSRYSVRSSSNLLSLFLKCSDSFIAEVISASWRSMAHVFVST
uniref:Uncharacterized protein n=1 Tax=Cacopsylla melanoneura TaxID=428564 RepID=A0A8D8QE45_9HEMI